MPSWIEKFVIDYLLKMLTDEKLDEWAALVKEKALPYLYEKKEVFIKDLRIEAEKTKTPVDDRLVEALDRFLTAFFPDNQLTL